MANRYCNVNGNDSWDGTAQTHQGGSVGPWLTANHALDQMALSENDGNKIIFGDGTFTYSNNSGRAIFGHALIEIDCENPWQTTLLFSGTSAQGLRFNADTTGAEQRTVRVGKLYIQTSGTGKNSQVQFSGNNASCAKMTVEWSSKTVPPSSASAQVFGLDLQCSNLDITIMDGAGAAGVSTSIFYLPIYYLPNLTVVRVDIDIQSFYLDLHCRFTEGIKLASTNAITGTWEVRGVTGHIHDSYSSSGTLYGIRISGGPDDCIIEDCNDLAITVDYPLVRTVIGMCIDSQTSLSITTNRPVIRNCDNFVVNANEGMLVMIGGENSDHNTPNGIIEGVNVRCIPSQSSYGMHGICHIGCLGGIRRNNRVDGASIGSLTKLGTAVSHDNYYSNVGGKSNVYLYSKGGESSGDGTKFINEVCEIPNGFTGRIEQCLEDNGGQDSINVEFRGTKVIRLGNADLSASAILHKTGSVTDTSDSTSTGMTIDIGLTLPTAIASVSGTDYGSIAAANGAASISCMWQSYTRLLCSNIGAVGIARVGVPAIEIAPYIVVPIQ